MIIEDLMDELLDHGCILQSREALAKSIIGKHLQVSDEKAESIEEESDAPSEER